MKPECTYRQAVKNDFAALKALGKLAYGQFRNILQPEGWKQMQDYLDNEQKLTELLAKSNCFVCLDNEKQIGMAYLVRSGNPTVIYPADWSYIRMVGVHPNYRGHGIARKLTLLCIDHARQTGEKIIGLHTSEIMPDVQHIYESFGFKIDRGIDALYGVKYWVYKLEL